MATAPAMKIVPPYTPELLDAARVEVERFLASRDRPAALEFGSGWSTIWLGLMCGSLTSVEHDPGWHDAVDDALWLFRDVWCRSYTPLVNAEEFVSQAQECRDGSIDLVLIDCIDEQRIPCLIASKDKVKPDGWLILDDTHWPLLNPAFEIMSGWKYRTFHGYHVRKDGSTHYHHTTVFYREESTWVSGVGKPAW